ncbi:MAG: hypothetical protein MUP55_02690 [Candidatus Aenigmarchaeota archaeon]|nr:hypothetical protein [Candidatus Aenigmarchaeota archaeon]
MQRFIRMYSIHDFMQSPPQDAKSRFIESLQRSLGADPEKVAKAYDRWLRRYAENMGGEKMIELITEECPEGEDMDMCLIRIKKRLEKEGER